MPSLDLDAYPLEKLANQVGTPFYLMDGAGGAAPPRAAHGAHPKDPRCKARYAT